MKNLCNVLLWAVGLPAQKYCPGGCNKQLI
jgi:hypothetical protein